MIVAVPREAALQERRVALVPETVAKLAKSGAVVRVQRGAGNAAAFPDELYERAGATLVDDAAALADGADIVVTVGRPSDEILAALKPAATVVGFLNPLADPQYARRLDEAGVTALAMEMIPRVAGAQVDGRALVSSRTSPDTRRCCWARSRCEVLSDAHDGRGNDSTGESARARRRGCRSSSDRDGAPPRRGRQRLRRTGRGKGTSAVSGATFLEFDLGSDAEGAGGYAKELTAEQQERQRAWMVEQIGANDVVVTTALVPGRKAPILVSEAAVAAMRPGSAIVNLAAEAGGNCALTVPGEIITTPNGVTIVGTTNLPSTMPNHASQLYSRNVFALLSPWIKDGTFAVT